MKIIQPIDGSIADVPEFHGRHAQAGWRVISDADADEIKAGRKVLVTDDGWAVRAGTTAERDAANAARSGAIRLAEIDAAFQAELDARYTPFQRFALSRPGADAAEVAAFEAFTSALLVRWAAARRAPAQVSPARIR